MKLYTQASLVLASIVVFVPSLSFAKEVVGITEETFTQLNASHCSYTAVAGMVPVDGGGFCDPVVAQLADNIVMRVEHHGEKYWINTADGLPIVNRYLDNGFYRAENKLYWVQDGFRLRLRQGEVFRAILGTAQRGDGPVTPINTSDFNSLMTSCEYHGGGSAATDSVYQSCLVAYHQGQALHARLAKSIVMHVGDSGRLFYIPEGGDSNPMLLNRRMINNGNTVSLYAYLWNQSQAIDAETIRLLPRM